MKNLFIIGCTLLVLSGCGNEPTIVEDSNKLYDQIDSGKSYTYEFEDADGQLNFVLSRDKAQNYELDYNEVGNSTSYYLIDDQLIVCGDSCETTESDLTTDYVNGQVAAGGPRTEELLSSQYAEMTSDTKESRTMEVGLVKPDDNGEDQYVFIERATISKDGKSAILEAECLDEEICKSYQEALTIEKVEDIENPIEQEEM